MHTLKLLSKFGVRPRIHESYTWATNARYLEGPATVVANARQALAGREDLKPVLDTLKRLYTSTVGKLAEQDHYADFHLWRPDWRDHVIGATKTAIMATLSDAAERSGTYPVAVNRDAIFYVTDDPGPISAWPGNPTKLGTQMGGWKPIGVGSLEEWGPKFLAKRTGSFLYTPAVEALHRGGEQS